MAASGSDNGVLERVKILEVAGVFRRRDALDAAAGALLLSGFDRADIDMVAGGDARERLGVHVPVEELPDVPGVPDAHKIDEMVRQSPERAYDITFFDEFARAAGWTERLSLENPELRPPS